MTAYGKTENTFDQFRERYMNTFLDVKVGWDDSFTPSKRNKSLQEISDANKVISLTYVNIQKSDCHYLNLSTP
jgi:hypothetical protein